MTARGLVLAAVITIAGVSCQSGAPPDVPEHESVLRRAIESAPGLVPASGYWEGFDTVATDGLPPGVSAREFLVRAHHARVRQSGSVRAVRFYVGPIAAIERLELKVWRHDDHGRFELVGTSADVAALLRPHAVNTIVLPAPIAGVREGDYLGLRVEGRVGAGPLLAVTPHEPGELLFVDGAERPPARHHWNRHRRLDGVIKLQVLMDPPEMVWIGYSQIAGHPAHYSFIERVPVDDDLRRTAPDSTIQGEFVREWPVTFQNMGIGGQTSAQIRARFARDALALRPAAVVIQMGGNDVLKGVPTRAFLENWEAVLDSCAARGVLAVVLGVSPGTEFTHAQCAKLDSLNLALENLVLRHRGRNVWVNINGAVGTPDPDGPPGNLWRIQSRYHRDGLHFNAAGHRAIARAIIRAVAFPVRRGPPG